MTRDSWLEAHPYLRPLAEVCARVERALRDVDVDVETPRLDPPGEAFEAHRTDFLAGVPLLRHDPPLLSMEPAGALAVALVRKLAADSAPATPAATLAEEARALDDQLRRELEPARRVAEWFLDDDAFQPVAPGLLRFLGWTAAARRLAPVAVAFAGWRDGVLDERWLRRYCPLCGSPPAMAQLVGADSGRKRLLACGACGSRWGFKRTKCPFCEADSERLSTLTIQGDGKVEAGLRIDFCESCRGYVKTYDGQGNESLLLSDWTTLHLDLLAQDRGLKRMAASLYELDSPLPLAAATT